MQQHNQFNACLLAFDDNHYCMHICGANDARWLQSDLGANPLGLSLDFFKRIKMSLCLSIKADPLILD